MVNSKRPSIAARAVLPNRSSPFSLYSAASSSSLRTVYHTTTATTTNTHGYSIQAYTVRSDSGARESLKTKSEIPQGYKQGIGIRKGYVFTGRVHGGLSTGGPAENPVGYETVERGEIVVHNQGESGPDCGSGPKTVEPGPSFGNGRRHSQHSKRRREPLVPPDTLSCKTELQKEHGLEIRQETVCLQLHDVSSETDFSSGHSSVEQSSGAEKNAQDFVNPHPGSDFEKGKQLVPVNNLQTTPDSKYPEPTEETWKGTPTVMSQQPIKPPWAEIIAQQFSKSELIMPSLIQACEKIGADTLDRRLRKLLHVYHTDLVRCATTPIQQKACRQLRSEKRKAKICSVIRSRLNLRSWGRIDTALRHFGQKTRRPATLRKRPQNQTEEKRFLFGGPGYRRLVELCTHLSLPEIQWKAEVQKAEGYLHSGSYGYSPVVTELIHTTSDNSTDTATGDPDMSIPGSLSGEYIMGLLRTWYPDTRMTQAAATAVASNPRNGEALRKLILGRTFDGHIVEAVLLSVASNPAWEFERVLDVLTSNPQLTRTILQSYGVVVRRDMNVHQVPELQIPGAWPQDPYITQSPPLEFIPYECSKFDRMRDWVERKLRMKVFWWPLDPPVTAGQENNMNMIWTCGCGTRLSIVLSQAAAERYQTLYQHAISPMGSTISLPLSVNNISITAATTLPTTPSALLALGIPPGTPPVTGLSSEQQPQANCVPDPTVMCCIPKSRRHTLLAQLPKSQSALRKDREFFQELRYEYCKVRSWKRWFGLSCVSSIIFGRFTRYYKEYVDCHGPEGVPPSNDPEYNNYDYTPKPPDDPSHFPMRELLHYFENPECAGTSENCLKIIPKRIVGKLGQERIAWGLELRQNLCPVRVTLLFMIVWSSSMGFASWWLSENPGDLQNATVPASMIATIATIAAILPDVFGHYQNNRNIRHP